MKNGDFINDITKTYPDSGPYIYGHCVQRIMSDGVIKERKAVLMLNGINGPDGKIGWYSKDFGPWKIVKG